VKRDRRREIETFGLSFLDCICCGFGAIILLLVLSKTAEPSRLEATLEELQAVVANLRLELEDITTESTRLVQILAAADKEVDVDSEEIAKLRRELSRLRGEFAATKQEAEVQNIIEGELAAARQELSEEMKRLLGSNYRRSAGDDTIGGIPVDSEYVIFIIDTSGSMDRYNWHRVTEKVAEILEIYPRLKGIQVMNDMGEYMYSRYRGRWIPDTLGRRAAILKQLERWRPFSNSSPVEGITEAIRTFRDPNRRISLYVFGDDFHGGSIERVIETVDRLNAPLPNGERPVRIHSMGFPHPRGIGMGQPTAVRFAQLMRVLAERHGGTFVGITR